MNEFSAFFKIYTKSYLSSKFFAVCLVILPIICVFTAIIFGLNPTEKSAKAVIFCEENGEIYSSICENLKNHDEIIFQEVESEPKLYEYVSSGKADVGFVFSSDFQRKIERVRYKDTIKAVSLENNSVSKFIERAVISEVFSATIPYIAKNKLDENEIQVEISAINDEILSYQDDVFGIEISYLDGAPTEKSSLAKNLINGIICIFLVGFSLASSAFSSDEKKSCELFIPFIGKLKLELYKTFPLYFLGGISAIVSIISTEIILKTIGVSTIFLALNLLVFQISLLFLGIILTDILNKELIIISIPFTIIFIAITHPIFFDLTAILPKSKIFLQILPSFNFLQADFTGILTQMIILIILIFGIFLKNKRTTD